MEEFIVEIRENMKNGNKENAKHLLNRDCLALILSQESPEIIGIRKGRDIGDIVFSVSLDECGLSSFEAYAKYKDIVLNTWVGNFLGEFFIRENIDQFAKVLTDLDTEEYLPLVNSWNHKKFGVEFAEDDLSFYFHASLIQKILIEDLRENI